MKNQFGRIATEIKRSYESEEMQAAVALLGPLARVEYFVRLVERTLLDGLVNAYNVLPHNASGTDIQMSGAECQGLCGRADTRIYAPNLRVSHESFIQADRNTVCVQRAMAMVL